MPQMKFTNLSGKPTCGRCKKLKIFMIDLGKFPNGQSTWTQPSRNKVTVIGHEITDRNKHFISPGSAVLS
jgi:hypothetical protein